MAGEIRQIPAIGSKGIGPAPRSALIISKNASIRAAALLSILAGRLGAIGLISDM